MIKMVDNLNHLDVVQKHNETLSPLRIEHGALKTASHP